MNRHLTRLVVATALAVPLLGAAASPAAAESVVLGSPLVSNYDGGVSNIPTVSVQLSFDPVTSPNPVVSPVNGTIVDWKVKSADDGATYTLKVMRPNGPVSLVPATNSNFTSIASAPGQVAVPAGTFAATPTGLIFDNPASLPISQGDYVGLLGVGGPGNHGLAQAMANGHPQSTFANNFAAQPADGSSANLLADAQHELLLQATIKFCRVPSVTGQSVPAATAALTAAECTSKVTSQDLRLKAIKKGLSKKKRKRIQAANRALRAQDGKVISQKPSAGETIAPATPVELTVGHLVKPPKKKHKRK